MKILIVQPNSSLSEYSCYTYTPKTETTTSRNEYATYDNQRISSTPVATTSRNRHDYEEDYFASCLTTQENTGQQYKAKDDILCEAVRSCLNENILQNL